MDKRYEIRLYDRTLLSFRARTTPLGAPSISSIDVDPTHLGLLPPALWSPTPEAILGWLSSRIVPKNRAFVDKICASMGLVPGDTFGIIDVCLGLSVNDAYWVVPRGFSGTWKDFNLYEHDLDAALALVAYTGHSTGQRQGAGLSSEWTTSGNYPKAWRRIDGELRLYKAGSPLNEGTANPDHGPYSEYFASQVAKRLGLPHVGYTLDVWEGRLASVCPLFTTEEVGFLPFYACTHEAGLAQVLPTARALGQDVLEHIVDQYVFDAIIANPDRHANNFGFLRSNEDGTWKGLAPLFDHNLAFFPYDMPSDFDSWHNKARAMRQSGVFLSNDELLRHIVGRRHHAWARQLLGIELADDTSHPVGETRLTAMETMLHSAGSWILEIDPRSIADVEGWIDADFGWDGGTTLTRSFVQSWHR